jgi:hypothetical protein
MATKAERFKATAQREAHRDKPSVKKQPSGRKRTKSAEVGRAPNPTAHNESRRAAKNSGYELEVSATTRPPRKSTRRSPTHLKTDSSLRITAMNRNASPQARAQRRGGNPT